MRDHNNEDIGVGHSFYSDHWFHSFTWKQVKRNVSRTVKWSEQQQKTSVLDFETLQNIKIFV